MIKMKSKRNERIVINISGGIFETTEKTLKRFPDTLLGDNEKRRKYYSAVKRDYYFDRNRVSFEGILDFYQSSGMLRCPPGLDLNIFAQIFPKMTCFC